MGTSLRKDEYVTDCSDIDDIIVFTQDGTMMITKVGSKTFIGKNIIHVAVFKKKDKRTTYNMIYKDGPKGPTYVKRFNVTGVTRDKEYPVSQGTKDSKVLYFTANPNGEAEVVHVLLRQSGSIKKLKWDLHFSDVLVKGRGSKGNIVTKYTVKRIELKEKGISTLKPRKIWFDETVQRLNLDQRGELVGEFRPTDRLLLINQRGLVKTVIPEITMHFDDDLIVMEKWEPKKPITAIHWAGEKELFYVKRFLIDTPEKQDNVLTDDSKSYLETIFTDHRPVAELVFTKERGKERKDNLVIDLERFIALKGIGALGNQLTKYKILEINALDPLPFAQPQQTPAAAIEVVDQQAVKSSESVAAQTTKETVQDQPALEEPAQDTTPNKEKEPPIDQDGQALLF